MTQGPADDDHYFRRDFCLAELRWAIDAGVAIQPVVRVEDKQKIGELLAVAPNDLQHLGGIDWIDLNRGNTEYFELGCRMVARRLGGDGR